jgi:hypothetical protein
LLVLVIAILIVSTSVILTARSAVAPYPSLSACRPRATLISVPRIMRVSLAKAASILCVTGVIAVCSCEKHRVGEMPDVQREQPDPAKAWLNATKKSANDSSASPARPESFPQEAR